MVYPELDLQNQQSTQDTKIRGKADFRGNRIRIAWPTYTAAGKMLGVFLDRDLLWRRRDRLLIFGFESLVKRG